MTSFSLFFSSSNFHFAGLQCAKVDGILLWIPFTEYGCIAYVR